MLEYFYADSLGANWVNEMAQRRETASQRSQLNDTEDRVRRLEHQVEK